MKKKIEKPGWAQGQDFQLKARVNLLHKYAAKEALYGIIEYLRERDSFKKEYFLEILLDAERYSQIFMEREITTSAETPQELLQGLDSDTTP